MSKKPSKPRSSSKTPAKTKAKNLSKQIEKPGASTETEHRERISDQDALFYHEYSPFDRTQRLPGKIEVVPSKRCLTQRDLSLAYTPGVAAASMAIAEDPRKAGDYTTRSNLVAVVTNGTAVLGLGDIGPLAAKPVMEGKGVLFKRFANINVFDIELNAPKPEDVIRACQMLEPTVGGINLEDIKAPDCFMVEEELRKTLKIPVFHDDQHGTAIIVGAAFLNALEIAKKKAKDVKVVFSGAGAAAIACANQLLACGVKKENIILCDKDGVVHSGRTNLDPYKAAFAHDLKIRKIDEALKGADVFIGLSVGGVITPRMIAPMAKAPMIFALANPTPEISYDEARRARPDAIVATGRSDFPNQVNNVLGFPSIFRGSLDVEASTINEEMKMAATKALAELTREPVPDSVSKVYGDKQFKFGPDYLIPKPLDHRVLLWVAPAVAEAAIRSGVAKRKIDIEAYREQLANSMDRSRLLMSIVHSKARRTLRKIVLPEGENVNVLKAANILIQEGLAQPILLGKIPEIKRQIKAHDLHLDSAILMDPETDPLADEFTNLYFQLRQRKGASLRESERLVRRKTYFGLMLVETGRADGLVAGLLKSYPETLRPALQIIRMDPQFKVAAGLYCILVRDRVLFFADTTVNIDPSAEELAEIAIQSANKAAFFNVQPRIAMVSFSNFGSSPHPINEKMRAAVDIVHRLRPDLVVDGEMQADTAVSAERLADYAFSNLKEPANILIFPSLAAGNIAYKLLQRLGNADVIGPVLLGLRKPVHVLQQGSTIEEIVRMVAIAAAEANEQNEEVTSPKKKSARARES